MKSRWAMVAALALVATHSAVAQPTALGHSALALAAVVGSYSPELSAREKATLAKVFEGEDSGAPTSAINVKADAVICRAGDIDITAFTCKLTFGPTKVGLTGRHANELFATIGEAGVPSQGGAGTIYEGLSAMSCVIDPVAIARNDGGGATCHFDQAP